MEGRLVEQTRMRLGIARRMTQSKQEVPHFYAQTEVVVDEVQRGLTELNDEGVAPRVTMTVVLARACAAALTEHGRFNAVWTPEGLLEVEEVNLGIAVGLDEGLVAPALLSAQSLDLVQTAAAVGDLVERARSQRLRPAELSEATFTLSNLGMFDVTAFTAIVTPPQVAIMATGRPVARWIDGDDGPVRASVLTATLSCDHRAVDGVDAARFLGTFKQAIEDTDALFPSAGDLKEAMS
jgi:pyruvate dehydrogenase E2 component (dihydrolipoamide acetyltransferase)